MSDPLPRALEILWHEPSEPKRSGGLSRERIVAAAVELADADGLGGLSMARLAERLGCGTMSLYRHVANKDELVTFMLSTAPGPPPVADPADWRGALTDWAAGLWDIYHRHPWVLAAAAAGPPADPGQLAWLNAGLAALAGTRTVRTRQARRGDGGTALRPRRGGAEHRGGVRWPGPDYPELLRRFVDTERFPALAAALEAGAFDTADDDHLADFHSGLAQLLDGVAARIASARLTIVVRFVTSRWRQPGSRAGK